MARSVSASMARILERLELERPLLLTSAELARMLEEEDISTPAAVFASRMREKGWLLPTGQRGVWEFAPAAVAGAYSSMDPLIGLKALLAAHEGLSCSLTFAAAAWAMGLADRAPATIDVAFDARPTGMRLPDGISAHAYSPTLEPVERRGVPCLAPESVVVHMATRPAEVGSWQSASEWLVELAHELDEGRVLEELSGRSVSVRARTGYLLQGMRPDVAEAIMGLGAPTSKVRFGPRRESIRNDERWMISDTVLPFDPRKMEDAR